MKHTEAETVSQAETRLPLLGPWWAVEPGIRAAMALQNTATKTMIETGNWTVKQYLEPGTWTANRYFQPVSDRSGNSNRVAISNRPRASNRPEVSKQLADSKRSGDSKRSEDSNQLAVSDDASPTSDERTAEPGDEQETNSVDSSFDAFLDTSAPFWHPPGWIGRDRFEPSRRR